MGKRKIRILTLIVIIIAVIAAVFAVLSYYEKKQFDDMVVQAENLAAEIQANQQRVYVSTVGIKRGEKILTDDMAAELNDNDPADARDEPTAGAILSTMNYPNVQKQMIYTSLTAGIYIDSDNLGAVAVVDIPAGVPIMKNMIRALEITQDTREYEINAVSLMVDQQENDIIDVRITYPNGEDYLILSKKQIKNLSLKSADFWTYMTEDELLRYTSAVIDAYQTTGAKIYSVRYVESNLQNEAVPNYLVRSETIDLMRSDPNIYATAEQTMNASARMSLEMRLGQLTDDQLSAVANGFNLQDTARNSVLSQNVNNYSGEIQLLGIDDGDDEEEDDYYYSTSNDDYEDNYDDEGPLTTDDDAIDDFTDSTLTLD